MDMVVKRFDVWLIDLNPTKGSEIRKVRPCLVISPDETNKFLATIIVIPLTTTIKNYPIRITCFFEGKQGQLAIDQIRSIDRIRLVKKLGTLDDITCKNICSLLIETFNYQ